MIKSKPLDENDTILYNYFEVIFMNDIEISRNSIKLPITEVASKIGIPKEDLYLYGDYKAKIKTINTKKSKSKLILVTAINPTAFGEGKTTVSIGLGDALNGLGKKVLIANVLGELAAAFLKSNDTSALFYWLYGIAAMLQIYFDFSAFFLQNTCRSAENTYLCTELRARARCHKHSRFSACNREIKPMLYEHN